MGAPTMVVVDSNLLALIQATSPLNRVGHGLRSWPLPSAWSAMATTTPNSPQHREALRAGTNVENRSAHA